MFLMFADFVAARSISGGGDGEYARRRRFIKLAHVRQSEAYLPSAAAARPHVK